MSVAASSVLIALLAAIALAEPAHAVAPGLTVEGRSLNLDGKPWFPIISWAQCTDDVENNIAAGVNLFMQSHCGDFDALGRAIGDRAAYVIAPYSVFRGRTATPQTNKMVGYHQPDEPDMHRILPEQLPDVETAEGTTRPVFLTLTSKFASEQAPLDPAIPRDSYATYVQRAHVVGFTLYPLVQFCYARQFGVGIDDVYNYQRELTALTSGPTYQWIELTKMEGYCGDDPLTAADVRAEIWMSIAGGATAVGYFTHNWVAGLGRNFDVAPEIVAEMTRSSREIQDLSPVLLADQVAWSRVMAWSSNSVKIGARNLNGRTWIIAVNSSRTETVKASFGIRGAGSGTAQVWRQNRIVPVKRGTLTDTFAPGAVHVYALRTRHSGRPAKGNGRKCPSTRCMDLSPRR